MKKIAQYLNTDIKLQSEPGKGSLFSIDFNLENVLKEIKKELKESPNIQELSLD